MATRRETHDERGRCEEGTGGLGGRIFSLRVWIQGSAAPSRNWHNWMAPSSVQTTGRSSRRALPRRTGRRSGLAARPRSRHFAAAAISKRAGPRNRSVGNRSRPAIAGGAILFEHGAERRLTSHWRGYATAIEASPLRAKTYFEVEALLGNHSIVLRVLFPFPNDAISVRSTMLCPDEYESAYRPFSACASAGKASARILVTP